MYDWVMSMPDMLFLFVLALILFGPKRLPQIGREVGKFMAEFKRASNDFKYQLQREVEQIESTGTAPAQPAVADSPAAILPPTPPVTAETSVAAEIDAAQERLRQTARLAFEAQNFTLRPPEAPVVATQAPEAVSAVQPESGLPAAEASAATLALAPASPVATASHNPLSVSDPDPSNPATQNS